MRKYTSSGFFIFLILIPVGWSSNQESFKLNYYLKNSYHYPQLLHRFHITGSNCDHKHYTSIAKINGIWQIDDGYARGIEAFFPALLVEGFSKAIAERENYDQG